MRLYIVQCTFALKNQSIPPENRTVPPPPLFRFFLKKTKINDGKGKQMTVKYGGVGVFVLTPWTVVTVWLQQTLRVATVTRSTASPPMSGWRSSTMS